MRNDISESLVRREQTMHTISTHLEISSHNTTMLKIIGQHTSSGTITVPGSKNAALPLLGASIFVDHVTLENMPDVSDIHIYINILKSIGSKAQFENGTLTLDNTNLSLENIDVGDVSKMRAAYYLIPGLLFRFGHAKIPYPG